jgi:hypothetical protein
MMTSDAIYKERVQTYGWDDISKLWIAITSGNTPGWAAGKAFEFLILRAFELSGAEVCWPYSVNFRTAANIEQIDGLVYVDELAVLIESKDYSEKTGEKKNIHFEPIAKMRSQLSRRPANMIGCIFSSGDYTEAAQILINFTTPETILSWNGSEMAYCILKRNLTEFLRIKYRRCLQYGTHDFDVTSGSA